MKAPPPYVVARANNAEDAIEAVRLCREHGIRTERHGRAVHVLVEDIYAYDLRFLRSVVHSRAIYEVRA